jgi:hypothetical protein
VKAWARPRRYGEQISKVVWHSGGPCLIDDKFPRLVTRRQFYYAVCFATRQKMAVESSHVCTYIVGRSCISGSVLVNAGTWSHRPISSVPVSLVKPTSKWSAEKNGQASGVQVVSCARRARAVLRQAHRGSTMLSRTRYDRLSCASSRTSGICMRAWTHDLILCPGPAAV